MPKGFRIDIDSDAVRRWVRDSLDQLSESRGEAPRLMPIEEYLPDVIYSFRSLIGDELIRCLEGAFSGGTAYSSKALDVYARDFQKLLDDNGFALHGKNGKTLLLAVDRPLPEGTKLQDFRINLIEKETGRLMYRHPVDPSILSNESGCVRMVDISQSLSAGKGR